MHGCRIRRDTRRLQPEIRYATAGDLRIAYQVMGEDNPIDLVWAPPMASHLVLDWEWPASVEVRRRLARFCRLIRFDKRGTGLSDRVPNVATLEERSDDIRAVMDAAGSERAVLLGTSEGGSMACLFAATHPERTRSLILWAVQARWVQTKGYPWGSTRQELERMIRNLAERGPDDEYLFGVGAGISRSVEPSFYEFFKRYAQAAASPSAYADLERMNAEIDVRDILSSIRVPTLVMSRLDDEVAEIAAVRELASAIPGSRFVEFPGSSHGIFAFDEPVLAEIEEFVTGASPEPSPDRVLRTMLFVDIVGSTERAAQVGDAQWKRLLVAHRAAVRRELGRFDGTEMDTAGDGFLATFDGPGRAVRCAQSIVTTVQELDLRVRAGIHTGEVELVDGTVAGIAVHTAARVASAAAPDEVLVTSTLRDLVAGSGLAFNDAGSHELKGVPGTWQLFALAPEGQ